MGRDKIHIALLLLLDALQWNPINEVLRDWKNEVVISGDRLKRNPNITHLREIDQNLRYIGAG